MATRHRFSGRNSQATGGWTLLQPSSHDHHDSDDSFGESEEPEIMANSSRDRTVEFASVLKSMRSRNVNGKLPQVNSNNTAIANRTEFSRMAKRISTELARTYEKLQKLSLLCKKRTLFDDKPVEIQELTYIIKQDINSLKNKIKMLEERKANEGTNRKDAQRHTNSVVKTLRSKLAGMSESFKSVLETRRENMKYQKLRKDEFSSNPSAGSANAQRGSSLLLMDEQRAMSSGGGGSVAISIDDGMTSQSSPLLHQSQSLDLVEQQDNYITERANTMETIESTIVELGSIFTQLATMVKEQEEQVMRIDSNVEESELNIEAAHGEMLRYFQGITSNRWLMIKIFLVLIVFFIIFVVFFA